MKILKIFRLLVPPIITLLISQVFRSAKNLYNLQKNAYIKLNIKYKNIHGGKRCFILCTGPSINQENLMPLTNEICFSVSNFYKHPLFKTIKPNYHCVPNIFFEYHSQENIAKWFIEMGSELPESTTLFLSAKQKNLIENKKLFMNRKLSYLLMGDNQKIKSIDMTKPLFGMQSVPIMCITIALYMGFKEIYLLGVEHNSFKNKKYEYFFKEKTYLNDPSINSRGEVIVSQLDDFENHLNLWKQYLSIKEVSNKLGANIINLTRDSALDIFEFSTLEEVLKK